MIRRLTRLLAIGLLAGAACLPSKAHAQVSNMCSYKPVTTPLAGTECWPILQNGITKTITAQQFFKTAVQGPSSSTIGNATVWANGTGTSLGDAGGPPIIKVGTTAAMSALQIFTGLLQNGFSVLRTGYWANGDSPSSVYSLSLSPCSLNAGVGDGGSQIPTSPTGRCWLLGAQSTYDVRTWGATGLAATTTGTISAGFGSLVVANSSGYAAGQNIVVFGAGTGFTLNPVTGVSITPENASGSSTYCVRIVTIDADHGYGAATTEVCHGSMNTSFAIPNAGSDSVDALIQWSTPGGTPPSSYAIYTGSSGAETCQAVSTQNLWRDYAQADGCPSWLPTSPPSAAGSDLFHPTIASVSGNTLNLTSSASTNCTSCTVEHDDTAAIQNALGAETVVSVPCGTFHTTSGITLTGNGESLLGQNKNCSIITPSGAFEVIALGNGGTAYTAQTVKDLQIRSLDMAAGDCMALVNTNAFNIAHVSASNCYNEVQVNNVFLGGKVEDFFSTVRRRGDYGWHIYGTGSGAGLQSATLEMEHINSATSFQGISFHVDGNVASLRSRYFGMQAAPFMFVSDNAIGAAQTPLYGFFYDMGFNACWRQCIRAIDSTALQFYAPFIQQVSAGGANNSGVFIAGVDNTQTPPTGSVGFQIHGGIAFGGNDTILDNGTGTILEGINVYTTLDAAIVCAAGSNGLNARDINTYIASSNLPIAAQDYGIKLNAGCSNANIAGTFVGNVANILNAATPTQESNVNGQIDPLPTVVLNSAPYTLTAASFPWAYGGGQSGTPVIIEVSGATTAQNVTSDTATNILASLNNPQAGTPINFIVRNHNHKTAMANPDAVLTLVGGTGVTVNGTATVPDAAQGMLNLAGNPQSGLYTFRKFQGSVNSGGTTITITGCSTVLGHGC